MTRSKQLGLALSALMLGLLTLEVGERVSVPRISGYISTAVAIVGSIAVGPITDIARDCLLARKSCGRYP